MTDKEALEIVLSASYHCGCCDDSNNADKAELLVARIIAAKIAGHSEAAYIQEAEDEFEDLRTDTERDVDCYKNLVDNGTAKDYEIEHHERHLGVLARLTKAYGEFMSLKK